MEQIEKINKRINEYEQGHVEEYVKPDGTVGLFNKLDYEAAKKYKAAKDYEKNKRIYENTTSTIIYVLVIIIVLVIMVVIYINMTNDITGIYYDKNGNKIEVYHTKTTGRVKINGKSGNIKKINADKYGIYMLDEAIIKNLEEDSKPLAAYVDLKTRDIVWKNNIWKLDVNGYRH
jgi:hypothetical protein